MQFGVKHKFLLITGLLAIFFTAYNQGLTWKAGFHSFFDNREYFNNYDQDKTMFGSRIFGEAGLDIDGKSSINAGISHLYEFGSKEDFITPALKMMYHSFKDIIAPDFVMYYSFKDLISLNIGVFPRKNIIEQPLFLLTDTFNYYRPYVEGFFFEFRRPFLFHNIWLDWTGRQAPDRRESFIVGASGRISRNVFFYEHHISFYHYALPLNSGGRDHIQDNGGLLAMVGTDFSKSAFFDTLLFSSGLAFSYDRLRSVYDTKIRLGWYSSFNSMYKGFGISGDLHFGDNHLLLNGDKLYRSGFYQRYNIYYLTTKLSRVNAKFQFSFHITPGNVDFTQLATVFVMLNGRVKLNENILKMLTHANK